MNEIQLKNQLAEMEQLISAFFGREKTATQSSKDFKSYCSSVLEQIASMIDTLKVFPVYGAIGFVGKFQFVPCPQVASPAKESSIKKLEELRQLEAIQLAESAKPAWDYLLKEDPETLCAIVALCYMAQKNQIIRKRIL